MTETNELQKRGAWFFHSCAEQLRAFVSRDLPQLKSNSTQIEWQRADDLLKRFEAFCHGDGTSPPEVAIVDLPANASPAQTLAFEISDFCHDVGVEWATLNVVDQRHLRVVLAHVFDAATAESKNESGTNWIDAVVVILATAAWVILFAIGYTVHAGPYQDVISEPQAVKGDVSELAVFIGALLMFIIASIPTNVMLLACLAGVLGTGYRRVNYQNGEGRLTSRPQDYTLAITTSFFFYLVVIGGLLSLSVAEILTYETQEKHLKLAGTVSMCAFLVGYDRNIVAWMLQRVATFLMQNDEEGESSSQSSKASSESKNNDQSKPSDQNTVHRTVTVANGKDSGQDQSRSMAAASSKKSDAN